MQNSLRYILLNFGLLIFLLFYFSGIYSQVGKNGVIRDTVIGGVQYYTDGVLLNGLEEGQFNFWNTKEVLVMKGKYKNGSKVGFWHYYDLEGILYKKGSYSVDTSIIQHNISHRSEIIDTVLYKGTFEFDDFEGDVNTDTWVFDDDDESVKHVEAKTFIEKREGLWEFFDKKGQVLYQEIYKNGEMIEYIKLQDFPSGFDDFEDRGGWDLEEDSVKIKKKN